MEMTSWKKIFTDNFKQKLPTRITLSRIILTLPVILMMMSPSWTWRILSAVLFSLAALTDYFDGYFARKFNATSNFGKLMDPVADKILVTSTLTFLLYLDALNPWIVALIVARDNFIGGIRAVAAADNLIISAKPSGKWKAAIQMVAIPVIMCSFSAPPSPAWELIYTIATYGLWLSVILSMTSGLEYMMAYLKPGKTPCKNN